MLGVAVIHMLLDQEADVYVITRNATDCPATCTVITADLVNRDEIAAQVKTLELDVILHLAAQSQVEGNSLRVTFDANVVGTLNLLEVARRFHSSAAIIIASSSSVVPHWRDASSRSAAAAVFGPYVASKMCTELIARSYSESYNLSMGIARLSNIYGPSDRNLERLVPSTICSILHERVPTIRSDPRKTVNLLYVEDAADALLQLAKKIVRNQWTCYTVAVKGEHTISIAEMIEAILTQMKRLDLVPDFKSFEQSIADHNHQSSNSLCDEWKWKPKTTIAEGLRRTIEWYRSEIARN